MPPRYLTLAIVAFWLATTGWLCYREVWPHFRSDEAPPFTIDLADEAQLKIQRIRWVILRADKEGEKPIGRARTWVDHRPADDTFELHSEIEQLRLGSGLITIKVPQMASMYRVNREGDLKEMSARAAASLAGFEVKAQVNGEVHEQRFWPHCQIQTSGWGPHDLDLDPVVVSSHGTVLNPLHPVNRLVGLRSGQRWRMPLVDPMADALRAMAAKELPVSKMGPRFLDAEVLPTLRHLSWNGNEVPCRVIEYRSEDGFKASTWVRESDGLVLRQQAELGNDVVILQRE